MKITKNIFPAIIIIAILIQLINSLSFAQVPQKMSYQAVIRNLSNNLVTSKPIGMRISILQGSISGATVYKEIYNPNPQTNANGLVTVEIGGGTAITGVFANINWANGPYFVKTETDPNGGTAYSITGINQLLSVPYALHAKTADNGFSGNYEDLTNKPALFDGQNICLTGAPNLSAVATSGNYNDLSNRPVSDGSETKVTAGINTNVTGTGTVQNPYVVNSKSHYIGEHYGGGIVFYVYDNGQHGFIADINDVNGGGGVVWDRNETFAGATITAINGGQRNTTLIISSKVWDGAAKFCAGVRTGGYGDWYLPSIEELRLLFLQKNVVGGFANENYWSSTEELATDAYFMNFYTGESGVGTKKSYINVRAIRSF